MSKSVLRENRFDFRRGLNTAISPDLLNPDELVNTTNTRLTASYGGFTKRSGCQKIHQTAFPAVVRGTFQWDDPISGLKQVVVASNGNLYYRNGFNYATAFTNVGGAPFTTTALVFFQPFRAATAGAPLILFIACDGELYTWTGAVLTRIDGVASAPTADRIIAYHTRLFARQSNLKKHIFWSRVGNGEYWTTGTKTDGGSAFVDVLNGEELVALEVIGSSLIMAAEDSVMRFTGHASDDIVISQDTEGISSEVGAVGPLCLKRFENYAAMFSDRGPYIVTETGVEPIGEQIAPNFAELDTVNLPSSVLGWNRGRKELMFAVSGASDSDLNKTVYVQGVRLQSWYGPWVYTFGITYLSRYEDVDGLETVISGGNDGFIRDMDVGSLDDILYDGSGGSAITMTVELPPLQFGQPGITKALKTMALQANLPAGSDLKIRTAFDEGSFTEDTVAETGTGIVHYRVDLNGQGERVYLQFVDASSQLVTVAGFVLEAWNMERHA